MSCSWSSPQGLLSALHKCGGQQMRTESGAQKQRARVNIMQATVVHCMYCSQLHQALFNPMGQVGDIVSRGPMMVCTLKAHNE